jgi:hypothetical protein
MAGPFAERVTMTLNAVRSKTASANDPFFPSTGGSSAGLCFFFSTCLVVGSLPRSAMAQWSPSADPVNVVIKDSAPLGREVALEYNPLALLIERISVNIELAAADHHALVLSSYYFYPSTAAFTNASGQAVRSQRFVGFGGELGYRYYGGRGGLRGVFVGPSFIAAWGKATAGNGAETVFGDFGVAADVGYQALVAERWVVSLGAGVQYSFATRSIPAQQMPANLYANSGLQPRLLFALGYAL